MKKKFIYGLLVLLILSGCGKKTKPLKKKIPSKETTEQFDIPLAGDEIQSIFTDDVSIGELKLDDEDIETVAGNKIEEARQKSEDEDFDWIQEVENEEENPKKLQTCYFGFGESDISIDQQDIVKNNVEKAKTILKGNSDNKIIIEGHACSSAGSRTYNMALSERRAKTVADKLNTAGVPMKNIKVVARGQECPALDNSGNPITGDKITQAPNRRAELYLVNG